VDGILLKPNSLVERQKAWVIDLTKAGCHTGTVAEDILAETARVLLAITRIRQRYPYTDADVQDHLQRIRQAAL
jgi:hypothetical protein